MPPCSAMNFPPLPSMFGPSNNGLYYQDQSCQDYGYQQNQMYGYQGYPPGYMQPAPPQYSQPAPVYGPVPTLPSQTSLSLPPFNYSRQDYQHSLPSTVASTPTVPTLASSTEVSAMDHLLPPLSDTSRRRQSSQGSSESDSGSEVSAKSSSQPGPIPARKQIDSYYDQAQVRHVWFEYSRNSIRHDYDIRCDVDTINIDDLSPEFKTQNCVYPRAMMKEYTGNRLKYESECNRVGWQLAELNPILQGKRGLIQRAVDTWRNSHADTSLLSRRAKRQTQKHSRRAKAQGMRPSQKVMLQLPPAPQSSIHSYRPYDSLDEIPTTQASYSYITPLLVPAPGTADGIQYSL